MQDLAAQQWQAVLDRLSTHLSPQSFETWFSRIELLQFDSQRVELGVGNRFIRAWLQDHYMPTIREAVADILGNAPKIDLKISKRAFREIREAQEAEMPRLAPHPPREFSGEPLNREFRLDEFVVGPSNRLAHAACVAVAEKPADVYNPLFIYAGAGLGKTHLLQGMCQAIRGKRPEAAVVYVSCEAFLNQYVNAVQARRLDEFRARYRRLDVLAIDDIHFLGAKARTQDEFHHTFDALRNLGRQVVLSSDAHAKEIAALQGKLVTRFVSGLVARISPPELETRVMILKRKAAKRGLRLRDDLCGEIARQIDTNVRELEGALTKVAAVAAMEGREPDEHVVRVALRDLLSSREGPVSLEDIVRAVVAQFKVSASDIRSRKRTRKVLRPRQIAMFVAKHATDHSLAEIGSHLGGRDHATVVHAAKKIRGEIAKDGEVRRQVESVFRALGRPAPNLEPPPPA